MASIKIDSSDILDIVTNNKDFKIYAGPGAGKTYLLINNIKNIIEKSTKIKSGNGKVLCITYTNAATDEIKKRLGSYNSYVFVSTIHSFLYEYVLKNYQQQIKIVMKKEFGEEFEFQNTCKFRPQQEGFRLLTKDDEEKIKVFIKEEYGEEYNIDSFSRIKIEEINVNIKPFNTYAKTCPNVATINHSDNIDENFAKKIKKSIWAVSQKLDFDEILFFSYKIILKYRHVRYLLNSLFPYVFIDEYQDTNPIQNSLIKQFADNKNVVLGVIGDVAQSIYHFQSADYREFEQFKTNNKELVEYVIDGNRRSTSNIIHFLNYLRKTDLNLDKQYCKENKNNDKVHFLIRKNKSAIIINHIKEPKTLTVLCRRWADVFQYVTGLDQVQQSIINSIQGYYTYQLKRDFFTEIEQHKINWIKVSSFVVSIRKALNQKSLAKAIQISNEYFDMNFLINSNKNQATIYESWIKFIKIIEKINEDDDLEKIVDELAKNCLSVKLPLLEDFSIYKNEEDAENPIFFKNKKNKIFNIMQNV